MPPVFNPARGYRWNCDIHGCMNKLVKPKLEVFARCFGGRVNFGDIDALVECNGAYCVLEWKTPWGRLPDSQAIALMGFTRYPGCIGFVVAGDAITMECIEYAVIWKEKYRWVVATSDQLFERIGAWWLWAASDDGPGRPFYDISGLVNHVPLVPPLPQVPSPALPSPRKPPDRVKPFSATQLPLPL